jgi:TolB-like protein
MGSDEDLAFELLRKNRELQNRIIKEFDGSLIKEMGDGLLISFPLASNAVRCAKMIQVEAEKQDIPLRIGIHSGEMVFEGADVLGDSVNVASRLQEISNEGSITISGAVYRDIKNISEIKTEYVSEERLKNVDEPVKIYKVYYKETLTGKDNINKPPRTDKKSIIVLPFENLSPDPENAYFADGLTEELIAELCKIKSLLVISRTSAMVFKETKKSISEIARAVNVSYVLEGSVRRAENNLRISAQLIDATTDTHLWVERYSGTLDDVFDLQEKLSRRIVESMKGILTPEEKKCLATRSNKDPYVFEVWMKAKHEIWKFTKKGYDSGQKMLKNALEVVGENSFLYAALGYSCWAAYDFGIYYDKKTLEEGEKYAERSLQIDPDQPLAYIAKGMIAYKRGDMQTLTLTLQKAIELGSDLDAVDFMGFMLAEVGKMTEAHYYANLSHAANPLGVFALWSKACVHLFEGRFKDSIDIFLETQNRLSPEEPIFDWWLAQAYAFAGKEDEAREVFESISNMKADVMSDFSNLFIQAIDNNRGEVQKILDTTILKDIAETDEWFPNYLANCLMQVGETDRALYYLERAINWGFSNYQFLSQHNRFLKPLRENSQFKALMRRAKEKQEKFIV